MLKDIQTSAVQLADHGFRVFPLQPNSKLPAHGISWPAFASNIPEKTERRWSNRFANYNIGIATGHGILVLDFDCKDGQPGLISLDMMDMMGLPRSMRATTVSGGMHVYLSVPDDIGISISAGGIPDYPGLDIRCEGGYVVAPGSVVDGKTYAWTEQATLEPAPTWLIDILKAYTPRTRERNDDTPSIEMDTDAALKRAISYLKGAAPEAVEGAGGDQATYEVAAQVRDFGVSEEACFELLSVHWNEAGKAVPPWHPEDLANKVSNAYQYATGRPGQLAGLAEFEPVPLYTPVTGGIYRVPFDEAAQRAFDMHGDALIEGLLDQRSMAILYGASNTGKTFLGLDFAYHIASGRPWQGRETSQGLVVYVAAEGGRGIFQRIAALKQHYGGSPPLDIVPCSINLLSSKADIEALLSLVKDAERAHGVPTKLLVIDTLSRALAGGDENTSTDMGAFVKNADKIREKIKASLLFVHHSGKDAAKGARGWSGLRAATDTEIEIIENTIRTSKQRDMEPMKDLKFKLPQIQLGKDHKGRAITSCVVQIQTGTEFVQVELSGHASDMLDAFDDILEDFGEPEKVVTAEEWDAQFRDNMSGVMVERGASAKTSVGETTTRFLRGLRKLCCESGHIQNIKRGQYVRVRTEVI